MGIREIYSIVNADAQNNSKKKSDDEEEEEEDHLENTYHKSIYQIPASLTTKISKMLNAAVHQGHLDDLDDDETTSIKPIPKRRVSKHDSLVRIKFPLFFSFLQLKFF